MAISNWYKIKDPDNIISPALLVYPDRIEKNIQKMIQLAGGTDKLRPHIKTHKMAEIIKLQMKWGIQKFKCATIAEAELLAKTGAKDILLAIQPVQINVHRFFELIKRYPDSQFSTIVDNINTIQEFSSLAKKNKIKISLWLDINNGMNRTGIVPGEKAIELYKILHQDANIVAKGIHVYDGHLKQNDFTLRKIKCDNDFESVLNLQNELQKLGIKVSKIVAGGTPTFTIHAKRKNVEVSPGTTLLWDDGYGTKFKDLDFLPAAILATRVISNPNKNLSCFDLGHKHIAPENPLPRVHFLDINDCEHISQHEEHLVIKHSESKSLNVGELHYGVPYHICPTVSKYKNVVTIVDRNVTGKWKVAARDNKLYI